MKNNHKLRLIQGNEACAEAALDVGVKFFAGYPITPSTEIMEKMAYSLPPAKGIFIQMEDEIASISAVLGASLTGVKAMTATSGPGFSLMQENIGFGIMAEIPAVIVNVQRLGPSTGAPTATAQGDVMQAKRGSHGDYEIIALAPSTVEECYYLTVSAFNYSEKFRLPVIILLEEVIGHLRESVTLPEKNKINIIKREEPSGIAPEEYLPYKAEKNGSPHMAKYGSGYRFHVTGLFHDETGFPVTGNPAEIEKLQMRLRNKLLNNLEEIIIYKEYHTHDADILIIAYGSSVRSSLAALQELRKEGKKVGLMALKTIWPFPCNLIKEMCRDKDRVFVPEHNFGQIAGEVIRCSDSPEKVTSVTQVDGTMIKPEKIAALIRGQ